MKVACTWQVLSRVRDTGQVSQLELGVEIPLNPPWGLMHVKATYCGGAEAGSSWASDLNSCFLFVLISILPLALPLSRPVSRFLTAPGACSAHFASTPVHESSPFSRTTALLRKPTQSTAMEPWPATPGHTELTPFCISTALSCRFFRAEAGLEIRAWYKCESRMKTFSDMQELGTFISYNCVCLDTIF